MITAPRQVLLLGTFSSTAGTDASAVTGVTTGTSVPLDASAGEEWGFYFESIGTTSGGTILIEEASRPTYTGTWAQVASVSANSFTGGAQAVTRPTAGAYAWLRVRISSAITGGGSILVWAQQRGA